MKSVRDACELQPNALTIKLSDQIEQLDELIHTEGDGTAFFERTHISQGMQDLISEGIARLAGVSTQAIFHLKQAMGGGKTHLLVGFGLLAKHPQLRTKYCGGETNAKMFEVARVAAFNGRNSPPHCFWGEIAQQLGKPEVFREFWAAGPKAPDEKAWLELFEGKDPILILLDEMPPYFEELWSDVADRYTEQAGMPWLPPRGLDTLKSIACNRALWEDLGNGYVTRKPKKKKTSVQIIPETEPDDQGRVRLRVNPQNAGPAPRIHYAEDGPVGEKSPLLKDQVLETKALRVNFLVLDPSGQYETGDVVTWSNKLVLRNRLNDAGSKRALELFVAPAGTIR